MAAIVDQTPRRKLGARTWRALGAISLAGAVAALGAGVAYAYLTSTGSTYGGGRLGHLRLTAVTSASPAVTHVCTVSGMTPGESSTGSTSGSKSDTPCAFTVHLTATGTAYLGLNATVSGTGLYAAGGLRFDITDTATTAYTTAGGTVNPNSATHPLYVGSFPSGTHTFTVNFSLPASAASSFENKTAILTLTVHAVISGKHATTTGHTPGTACTKGVVCTGITRWS